MIQIQRFKPMDKAPLIGFLDIVIDQWRFEIRGITVMRKEDGRRWFNMPSKEYTKEDGTTGYSPVVRFTDDTWYKNFQKQLSERFDDYCKANQHQEPPQQGFGLPPAQAAPAYQAPVEQPAMQQAPQYPPNDLPF